MQNASIDQYNEMRDIAENKDYMIQDLINIAESNLVQDELDENRRIDLERKRNEEA
jgi:hypothetical protein